MTTVHRNPWKVESIQDFSCLKCPECIFFTKEENYFENHAIKNHPLSSILFQEPSMSTAFEGSVHEEPFDDVDSVNVGDIKKEPNSEMDPFQDTNNQWKGGHFMSSLIEYDTPVIDSSSNHVNQLKKLKMEPRNFDSPDDWITGQINLISKKKPKKRKREQKTKEMIGFTPNEVTSDNTIGYSPVAGASNNQFICSNQSYQYQCEDCGEKFESENGKEDFKIHWQTNHSQEDCYTDSIEIHHEFPCALCDYTNTNETNFRIHMESTHNPMDDQIHACSLCDFEIRDTTKFNNHLKSHKYYQCVGCENNFHGASGKALFKMHLETMQSNDQTTNSCWDEKYIINCDLCSCKFEEETHYKTHLASKHEKKEKHFNKCASCDFMTETVPRLIKHLKSHHKCHLCGERFHGNHGSRDLKRHLISHQKKSDMKRPKPIIVCTKCEKSFPFLSYFNRHVIRKEGLNST